MVEVECRLNNGGAALRGITNVTIIDWIVALDAPAQAFRLDEMHMSVEVRYPLLEQIPEEKRFPNASYFPAAMACSLAAINNSAALSYPGNVLTNRVLYMPGPRNSSAGYGLATYAVRLDTPPGTKVHLQADCELNGRSISSPPSIILINEFTAAWVPESLRDTWLPSSGTFLLPLQPPPQAQFWSNGVLLQDTTLVNCKPTITANKAEVSLMNPPPFGYSGIGDRVVLDRILIASSAFDVQVVLSVTCTRNAESLKLPPITITLPRMRAQIAGPFPPPGVVTQRPFQINLKLQPATSLIAAHARVQCSLNCHDAIAMSGAAAQAANGSVLFDSATITGVVGRGYSIIVSCHLGVMPLPELAPISVRVEVCPQGTEPDSSKTQCRAYPLNTYSDGGYSKCHSCPSSGATCSSGLIFLESGFYPADTRLLGTSQWSRKHKHVNASAVLLNERTVLYPCWNSESCSVDGVNRTYGCSHGYSGPLCGVCDAFC